MSSIKSQARLAGWLYLLTSIVGFFAMGYVPGKLIVDGNAAATANNIAASETLFRLGIAGSLLGEAGFILVALALYELLKGVSRRLATLMVILIVVSVPVAFLNEVNSIAAVVLVRGAVFLSTIEKPQRDALAMLFLNLHNRGFTVAEIFWGLWLFPLGVLVYRSRFLPRFLGVWLIIAGFAWMMVSLTGIMLPQYQGKVYAYSQPAVLGEVALMLWLIIRGAKPQAAATEASSTVVVASV
ncbi:MAG: DUF4386 domain-containing protein [Candidatus Sulfotelmatobacter sp.]